MIIFDDLIRMPAGENINRVLSLIQSSCLERGLHPKLQSCLGQSGRTAVLFSGGNFSPYQPQMCWQARGHTGIQAGLDADSLAKQGRRQAGRQILCCDHKTALHKDQIYSNSMHL